MSIRAFAIRVAKVDSSSTCSRGVVLEVSLFVTDPVPAVIERSPRFPGFPSATFKAPCVGASLLDRPTNGMYGVRFTVFRRISNTLREFGAILKLIEPAAY